MKLTTSKSLSGAGRFTVKVLVVVTAATGGAALVSSSVFASLSAIATSAGSVTSGTLSLTDSATAGSGGLTTAISNMAPGDTVNRYIDLVNAGSLDGDTPTVRIVDGTPTALTTDGTAGLQITITACTVAWTQATGVCSGSETTVRATTSALALASHTAITLPSMQAAATNRLKVSIFLPAGSEVTTDGVLPNGTIQGKSAALTWTFTIQQRTNTTTNS